MKTNKDFEDVEDFAEWIRANGSHISTLGMGHALEMGYRVGEDVYTIVTDAWTEAVITVYDPEP